MTITPATQRSPFAIRSHGITGWGTGPRQQFRARILLTFRLARRRGAFRRGTGLFRTPPISASTRRPCTRGRSTMHRPGQRGHGRGRIFAVSMELSKRRPIKPAEERGGLRPTGAQHIQPVSTRPRGGSRELCSLEVLRRYENPVELLNHESAVQSQLQIASANCAGVAP